MKQLFSLLLATLSLSAQARNTVIPGKADTVNYTHVLFELPYNKDAALYEVRLTSLGKKNLITGRSRNNFVLIQTGLAFNTAYSWQYNCIDKKGRLIWPGEPNDLYIQGTWHGDANLYRNVITVNKDGEYAQGYITLDYGAIIDRNGQVVWTFPPDKFGTVRDLHLTKDGTLTFLWNNFAYETDLKANVLWKSPDSIPNYKLPDYHHEFRKLDNGSYLCVARRVKHGEKDANHYSMVFEIDRNNHVKWYWDEKEHYAHDTNFHGTHMNAAYYDEKHKKLYLSHRDLNSIARVDVNTGRIDYSIGYNYLNNVPYYRNDWFSQQHAINLDADGNLLFFNNNGPGKTKPSSVLRISQPKGKRPPQVKWEYIFNFSDTNYNYVPKMGGVIPTPGGNFLVALGANNRVAEVNGEKEILWQTDAERYDSTAAKFIPMPSGYRAGFAPTMYP
jgi:hypothetical protein